MVVINIDSLFKYVLYLAGKDISGGFIPPDDWNRMVPIMVNNMVRKYYGLPEEYQPGLPMPRISYEITQLVTDYVSQLKGEKDYIVPDDGVITKPADYLHKSSLATNSFKVIDTDESTLPVSDDCCVETVQSTKAAAKAKIVEESWRPVTFVSEQERWAWLNNSLLKPTTDNPIAVFLGEDKIQIYPKNLKSAHFTYIRYPKTAKWDYTVVKGVPIYNAAGSQDVELPQICADELAVTILSRVGITIREPGLVDWSRYVKETGK